jgi:hypothetical protein
MRFLFNTFVSCQANSSKVNLHDAYREVSALGSPLSFKPHSLVGGNGTEKGSRDQPCFAVLVSIIYAGSAFACFLTLIIKFAASEVQS